ncbi:hypothetical protein E2C01_101619 [Portunus trituberculatus]|uniref:Uncharacterized protein n=1 Tax=Portunus trituberculatus TaxID=210409 RepID=A0A5B7KA25_PORTR|nr:hypothetical protein [Portunus trituberculatus]
MHRPPLSPCYPPFTLATPHPIEFPATGQQGVTEDGHNGLSRV